MYSSIHRKLKAVQVNQAPSYHLKLESWIQVCPLFSKEKHKSTCTKKHKVLRLTSIIETVTHHHHFYLETNAMLVSHGGEEHILNTETKKNNVYAISFSQKQRKKAWNQNLPKKEKKQSPLIKRPLPHVFHSFFCTYKPFIPLQCSICKETLKAKEGRDDEDL
jgi:hypothetical protein